MDDPKVCCSMIGVQGAVPVYNKKQRVVGYRVRLNVYVTCDCLWLDPSNEHEKKATTAEIVRFISSKGYHLYGCPWYVVGTDGTTRFHANFDHDEFFKKRLFVNAREQAERYAAAARKVMDSLRVKKNGGTNER